MLLINPYYPKPVHYGFSLGLGYIASALETKGHKVKIIDCQVVEDYKKQIFESLKEFSHVGISLNAGMVSSGLEIAMLIRKNSPSTKIIMGGLHATAIYDKLIPEYADVVVIGEGERTIVELVGSRPLKDIQSIAYWDNGLKLTPKRPLIEDLDSLAFPSWQLFDLMAYKTHSCRLPHARIITTRGCPYECIYCSARVAQGENLRIRSIDNVVAEIDILVNKFKVKDIMICDDNFSYSIERVKQFCNAVIKQRYRDLRFILNYGIRADFCDIEMFKLMKQAGFCLVRLGIESGSQEVLRMAKKDLDLTKVGSTIIAIKEAGIKVDSFFILGLPFDTMQTMQKTIDFAKTLPVDMALFGVAIPFPGTELFSMVKQSGRFLHDMNFESISIGKVYYETDYLKASDVKKMLSKAYRQFYLRPQKLYSMIRTKQFNFILNVIKMPFLGIDKNTVKLNKERLSNN